MAPLLDCERASANLGAVCQIVHARVLMCSARNQQRIQAALLHQGVEFGFHKRLVFFTGHFDCIYKNKTINGAAPLGWEVADPS